MKRCQSHSNPAHQTSKAPHVFLHPCAKKLYFRKENWREEERNRGEFMRKRRKKKKKQKPKHQVSEFPTSMNSPTHAWKEAATKRQVRFKTVDLSIWFCLSVILDQQRPARAPASRCVRASWFRSLEASPVIQRA